MLLTATSLGLNIWGSVLMRQEFNPLWFIPSSTYLSQYFTMLEQNYPSNGEMATMYVRTNKLAAHIDVMEDLIAELKNETLIVSNVDDWFTGFKEFVVKRHLIGK